MPMALPSVAMDCRVGAVSDTEKERALPAPEERLRLRNGDGTGTPKRRARATMRAAHRARPFMLPRLTVRCADRGRTEHPRGSPPPAISQVLHRRCLVIRRRLRRSSPREPTRKLSSRDLRTLARLKGASVVIRVGLGYDHWLDKLLSMHGDAVLNRGGAGLRRCILRHSSARGEGDRASIPLIAMGMPMASPIRTIGSILPMPRSSPAELQRRPFGSRLKWPKKSSPTAMIFLSRLKASLVEWGTAARTSPRRAPHRLPQHPGPISRAASGSISSMSSRSRKASRQAQRGSPNWQRRSANRKYA